MARLTSFGVQPSLIRDRTGCPRCARWKCWLHEKAADNMTPYSANPFGFIFSVVAVIAVVLYFAYGAIDRTGLEVRATEAIVTGKQFTPSGKSYYTTIAGGRAWV